MPRDIKMSKWYEGDLYWICLQKWHISREMPQKVSCCARIQWSWVFLRNKSFHRSCLNLPVQLWECSLVWVLLSYLSNQSLILYLFKCSLPAHTILTTWWKAPSNGPTQLMWLFWRVFQLDGLFFLWRGVRSDAQLRPTETRFQKCSQSGKNGSKHPMLSISMAYNVISCKKVERNTQKLKIADFTM